MYFQTDQLALHDFVAGNIPNYTPCSRGLCMIYMIWLFECKVTPYIFVSEFFFS